MASCQNFMSSVFLGTGKPKPGLWAIGPNEASASCLLGQTGHSVYAIDMDTEDGLVVVGTRGGRIHLLSWPDGDISSQPNTFTSRLQGSPVLSLCLVGNSQFASTDAAGRCLLWPPAGDSTTPKALEVDGAVVCSLLRLDENKLLGLSSSGRLLLWDLSTGQLHSKVDVPKPPTKFSIVRLIYWQKQNAVVYPSDRGELVVCGLGDFGLCVHAAHEGEFYAVIANSDRLYTIGKNDGLMKTWEDAKGPASHECQAPMGIVSGEFLDSESKQILLINSDFEAAIYAIEANSLQLLRRLEGNHYRIAFGPSAHARRDFDKTRRLARAQQLRREIEEKIETKRFEGIDALLEELSELGFKSASLGLLAKMAERKEDVIAELKVRHELVGILPSNNKKADKSLRRYGKLLELTWQLTGAWEIYSQLPAGENPSYSRPWLEKAVGILQGRDWIIEPDVPLPLLIEASTVTGKPFTGCWLFNASASRPFVEGSLSGQALARKYEQIRKESHRSDLPEARARSLWWISRKTMEKRTVVVFEDATASADEIVKPAIQIMEDQSPALIVPVILFDAGWLESSGSVEHRNNQLIAALERAKAGTLPQPWFAECRKLIWQALRRLTTEAKAHNHRNRSS